MDPVRRRDGKNLSYIGIPYSALKNRTPTIQQLVQWGYVSPSPESKQTALRIDYTEPVPGFCHLGICLTCGANRMTNSTGNCNVCWRKSFTYLPPEMEPQGVTGKIVTVFNRADIGALFENFYASVNPSSWKSDRPPPIGNYHAPARNPVPPEGASRPWQRYGWQVDDVKTRTACERLHPSDGHGVSLRCLICLGTPDTLRHDQVCALCARNWSEKAGEPWGEDFEWWIVKRRAKHQTLSRSLLKFSGGHSVFRLLPDRTLRLYQQPA
jgi:hypothetical protein